MTRREHALNLHDVALSLVRQRGRQRLVGNTRVNEYDYVVLTIRHWPNRNALDIYFAGRVLSIERWSGNLQVIRYAPGSWETDLKRRRSSSRDQVVALTDSERTLLDRLAAEGKPNSARGRRDTDCEVAW